MDFRPSDEQQLIVDTVRRFVRQDLEPISQQVEEEDRIPERVVQKMRELGLFGLSIPEEYGGISTGIMDLVVAVEELCKVDSGTALALFATGLGHVDVEFIRMLRIRVRLNRFAIRVEPPGEDPLAVIVRGLPGDHEVAGRVHGHGRVDLIDRSSSVDHDFVAQGHAVGVESLGEDVVAVARALPGHQAVPRDEAEVAGLGQLEELVVGGTLDVGDRVKAQRTASDEEGVISTHLHADGKYKDLLYFPSGVSKKAENFLSGQDTLVMRGNEVFKVAVSTLGRIVDETLEANDLDKHDIDWLIPHQANMRIINATARKLDIKGYLARYASSPASDHHLCQSASASIAAVTTALITLCQV